MIETNIYNALATSSAITAITETRIFPLVLPDDPELPAVTYQIVGGSTVPTMATRGTARSRIQIDCWGTTYASAVTLREAAIDSLAGYTDGTITVQILQTVDEFDHESLQYRAILEVYAIYCL